MLQAEAEERAAAEDAAAAAEQVSSSSDESSSEGSVEEQHIGDLKVPTASEICIHVESDYAVGVCIVLEDGHSAATCQSLQFKGSYGCLLLGVTLMPGGEQQCHCE